MLKTLRNAWKIKEIRTKLIFTFLMLVVIRFGSELPIPGVKTDFFANFFANQSTDAFGFFNAMTGGSFSSMSLFALSITPYITSSIIMQLLTIAIPKLEEMQRDGEDGRKKIAEPSGKEAAQPLPPRFQCAEFRHGWLQFRLPILPKLGYCQSPQLRPARWFSDRSFKDHSRSSAWRNAPVPRRQSHRRRWR